MAVFYADTSILLKQHVDEPGKLWFRELVASPSSIIMTTELSIVEVYSAVNRLVREQSLTGNEYRDLTIELLNLYKSRYELIEISEGVVNTACAVLERHPLRTYDAIHLASALSVRQRLTDVQKPTLTFLAADHRLLAAAQAEGLPTYNPAAAT
jgi:uncharacterized protein